MEPQAPNTAADDQLRFSLFLSLLVRSSSPTTSTPQSTTHQPAFVPFLIDLLRSPDSGVAKLWIVSIFLLFLSLFRRVAKSRARLGLLLHVYRPTARA